jgi:hypothetical protein
VAANTLFIAGWTKKWFNGPDDWATVKYARGKAKDNSGDANFTIIVPPVSEDYSNLSSDTCRTNVQLAENDSSGLIEYYSPQSFGPVIYGEAFGPAETGA